MRSFPMRAVLTLALAALFAACAGAQRRGSAPSGAAPAAPEAGGTSPPGKSAAVDFKALRLEHARSPNYDPYGGDEEFEAMMKALSARKFDEALAVARKVMEKNFCDIDAHFVAKKAYEGLGQPEKAKQEHEIVGGLIRAIFESGDGKTPETAMQVLSVREEYVILGVLGLESSGQGLLSEEDRFIDRHDIRDRETGQEGRIYFDVSLPHKRLQDQFSSPRK